MNILDIFIIIGLLSGASYGFRSGGIKTLVVLITTLISFYLAFLFKNPIANFLSYNLPFFSFDGLTSLNIIIYQLVAFILLLTFFSAIFVVIVKLAGGIEKILKFTIILSIPSKIIGFIFGLLESIIIIYVVLLLISGFSITKDMKLIDNSKYGDIILKTIPGGNSLTSSINDINGIVKSYDSKNKDNLNKEVTSVLVKNKVIDNLYLNKLRNKGKINY